MAAVVNPALFQRALKSAVTDIGDFVEIPLELEKVEVSEEMGESWLFEGVDPLVQVRLSVNDALGAFVFVAPEMAVRLGGKLLMLPADEVESRVQKAEMDDDLADAFGEVANLLAGALTGVFGKDKSRPLHFKKQDVTLFDPVGADSSSFAFSAKPCVRVQAGWTLAGAATHPVVLLISGALFGLTELGGTAASAPPAKAPGKAAEKPAAKASGKAAEKPASEEGAVSGEGSEEVAGGEGEVVESLSGAPRPWLLVGSGEELAQACQAHGVSVVSATSDQVPAALGDVVPDRVLLVLPGVDATSLTHLERLRGIWPKVSLAVAAEGWTAAAVSQAVNLGVSDIILLPQMPAEVAGRLARLRR